jgi:hypothetical protein
MRHSLAAKVWGQGRSNTVPRQGDSKIVDMLRQLLEEAHHAQSAEGTQDSHVCMLLQSVGPAKRHNSKEGGLWDRLGRTHEGREPLPPRR